MAPARSDPAPGQALGDWLLGHCPDLQSSPTLHVALSGGLDSTVLLHVLVTLRNRGLLTGSLRAVHVNHGLQADAGAWEVHCEQLCARLDVPLRVLRVCVPTDDGNSLEEAARQARHQVFEQLPDSGDCILLAQHRDDQVETLLQRLLRGSGPVGLSGMPGRRPCGRGHLVRPFLTLPRSRLLEHAHQHGLAWIEDPSNRDSRFERNHLRHAIMPALRERWPGVDRSLARSAALCAEAGGLLDELAALDLERVQGPRPNRLQIAALRTLSDTRQRNLLRSWLQTLHRDMAYPAPNHRLLQAIVSELLPASPDAEPRLQWGRKGQVAELYRFHDELFALRPLPQPEGPLLWNTATVFELPPPLGTLRLEMVQEGGLPVSRIAQLEVRFRAGGERFAIPGRPTRPLKKILQEHAIPPWLRDRVPLLYSDNRLVAVGDLPLGRAIPAEKGEICARIHWQRSDLDCGY